MWIQQHKTQRELVYDASNEYFRQNILEVQSHKEQD
jgi:hypothetical protein